MRRGYEQFPGSQRYDANRTRVPTAFHTFLVFYLFLIDFCPIARYQIKKEIKERERGRNKTET